MTEARRLKTPWLEIGIIALIPALDACLRLGRLHPDEVYQVLEPAMLRAFGFGVPAWEWQVGLRNWAVPGLFSLMLTAGQKVGLTDALSRRVMLEVPQYLLHAAMLGAVWRLTARRIDHKLARWAVVLVGLSMPLVVFAGRTLSESFSAAFLVWGLERLDARDAASWSSSLPVPVPAVARPVSRWAPFLGGALLGCAEVTRYGSAAIIVPAVLCYAASRPSWRSFGTMLGGGLLVALGLGLLDRLTWGVALPEPRWHGWWHSLVQYLDFNVFSGQAAAQFGETPVWDYARSFLIAPWAVLGLGLWLKQKGQRVWLLLLPAVAYVVVISLTKHKEPRFLYPALVLLSVAAAPAFVAWTHEQLVKRTMLGRALATLAVLGTASFFFVPTPFDVQRPEQFQFIVRAGREATGLVIMPEGTWGAGGYFYLGRLMPWCVCDSPQALCFDPRDPTVNRAIVVDEPWDVPTTQARLAAFPAMGFHLVEKRGTASYFAR